MLGGLGFVLAGALNIGHQRDMHEQAVMAANLQRNLADCLQKGLAFNIAGSAADFGDDHVRIGFFAYGVDEVFDFIGNMRNNLNGFAQIFPVSLFSKNVPVHFAGGEIGKPV